jgi:FdhD protein
MVTSSGASKAGSQFGAVFRDLGERPLYSGYILKVMTFSTVRAPIGQVDGCLVQRREDLLAVEEPLEIRVGQRSLSVTMRTPGQDFELAAGFLFAEGIIISANQIRLAPNSKNENPNILEIDLSPDAVIEPTMQREFIMTSACGVCGKPSLEALEANRCPPLPPSGMKIDPAIIHRLPDQLRRQQSLFEDTGGLHAAGLFDARGELQALREDVGRHNAVDKLIGHALLNGRVPLHDCVMLVSGRASFELVQKALMAGIHVLAAVGAPSSLAVATAQKCGMTLIGFVRNSRFNIYSGAGSITGLA